jgi:hypothetical protein
LKPLVIVIHKVTIRKTKNFEGVSLWLSLARWKM